MDKRQEAIEKVRKLLAMSDPASGASDNERDVAQRMAAGIMLRFTIDEKEVIGHIEEGVEVKAWSHQTFSQPWVGTVGAAAAVMNMTKCLVITSSGMLLFVGKPTNIETSNILFDHLYREVLRLYKEKIATGFTKSLPIHQIKSFRESFKAACADRIFERCWDIMDKLGKDDQLAIRDHRQPRSCCSKHHRTGVAEDR